jgi:L,D-transpeptidase-like protein
MNPDLFLEISISQQQLSIIDNGQILQRYAVSTAKNGAGERRGSECTPTGWHRVRAKIGAGQPLHAVFVGRRPTGEIYSAELGRRNPRRDWILTRILWLGGLEPGKNRYGDVDTAWRYIYTRIQSILSSSLKQELKPGLLNQGLRIFRPKEQSWKS